MKLRVDRFEFERWIGFDFVVVLSLKLVYSVYGMLLYVLALFGIENRVKMAVQKVPARGSVVALQSG